LILVTQMKSNIETPAAIAQNSSDLQDVSTEAKRSDAMAQPEPEAQESIAIEADVGEPQAQTKTTAGIKRPGQPETATADGFKRPAPKRQKLKLNMGQRSVMDVKSGTKSSKSIGTEDKRSTSRTAAGTEDTKPSKSTRSRRQVKKPERYDPTPQPQELDLPVTIYRFVPN
jgi:hypothetical protein